MEDNDTANSLIIHFKYVWYLSMGWYSKLHNKEKIN